MRSKRIHKNYLVKWEPPPVNYIKVNFDGSVRGQAASAGFIIRDHDGRMISAGTQHLGEVSVLMAEAVTLRNGVQKVIQLGYKKLVIEGDNATMI